MNKESWLAAVQAACEKGDVTHFQGIIDELPDVDAQKEIPAFLDFAIHKKQKPIIRLLIERGAGTDTALRLAIENFNKREIEVIRWLVETGADVNGKDDRGWTPLMQACEKGNIEVVKFLLEKGASIDAVDARGNTALIEASTARQPKIVKLLLSKCADHTVTDDFGRNLFLIASENDDLESMELLLRLGVDINGTGDPDKEKSKYGSVSGDTALMNAVDLENIEMARFLIGRGADVNLKNAEGKTPLMLAHEAGAGEMAELLIAHGAIEK